MAWEDNHKQLVIMSVKTGTLDPQAVIPIRLCKH